jgi:transposase
MNIDEFKLIAKLIRSREPVMTAARLVLVEGKSGIEAAEITGVSVQSVSNTVVRFRNVDAEIRRVYHG